MAVEGATIAALFKAYVEKMLAPTAVFIIIEPVVLSSFFPYTF